MANENPGIGCEPVRKNLPDLDITPSSTYWSSISAIPDFCLKLFTGEDYNETDDVIKLSPATVQHETTIAEDPGYIEPALFNYGLEQTLDKDGCEPGQFPYDSVLAYLLYEMWALYWPKDVPRVLGQGREQGSMEGHTVALWNALDLTILFCTRLDKNSEAIDGLAEEFQNKLTQTPYSILVSRTGSDPGIGHFVCAVVDMLNDNVYIMDSLVPGRSIPSTYSSAWVRTFKLLWARAFPDKANAVKFHYPQTEKQHDGCSCGFYAVHNAHRFMHALCVDHDNPKRNFEAVVQDPIENSPLPYLTKEIVDSWRIKAHKALYEHVRQQVLRKTFSNVEDYAKCPGRIFEPSDIQIGSYPKLSMTLAERDRVKFGPGTGPGDDPEKMRSRSGNRGPYDLEMVSFEKFNENTVFAQLVKDWKKEEVAGVIIRLSKSEKNFEQAMYKAVGWDQTVLLSTLPEKEEFDWSRPHFLGHNLQLNPSPDAQEEDIVKICWTEVQKLKKSRPDLQGEDLRLQTKYIAGMLSNNNLKLVIQPKKDGTTWAKQNWGRGDPTNGFQTVKINGQNLCNSRESTQRLPEYSFIEVIEKGTVNNPKTASRHAMYIWIQKWPYVGFADPMSSLDIRGAIPVEDYDIWDWWGIPGLMRDNQKEISNNVFTQVGGRYVDGNLQNSRKNAFWPACTKPRSCESTFFTQIESDNEPHLAPRALVGWDHKKVPPRIVTKPTQTVQSQPKTIPKLPSHSEAYLDLLFPSLQPSTAELNETIKTKKRVYLSYMLYNMTGPAVLEGTTFKTLVNPQRGHRHHHHRPEQILLDHKWRVRYYTVLQTERFPWRTKDEKNVEKMIQVCELLCSDRETTGQLEDAIEWRKFCELIKLGQKITELWDSPPLVGQKTMRCLSGNCEKMRKNYMKFDKEPPLGLKEPSPIYWKSYDQYQRWRYGAPECPVDCPLRDWDCPEGCKEVHTNPLGISNDEMRGLISSTNFGLNTTQTQHVNKVLNGHFPNRWEGAPPYFWAPVKPVGGFWDPKDDSNKTLDARISACVNRLSEWEMLTNDQRLAILRSEHIYYGDINQVVDGLDWPKTSQAAEELGKEVIEAMKNNSEYTVALLPLEASYNYMKRKLDDTTAYLDDQQKIWTKHNTFYKSHRIRFKKVKFSQMKEFW